MPILLLFALPFLEIYFLYSAVVAFGFVNVICFLLIKGLIGKLIMRQAGFVSQTGQPEDLARAAVLGLSGLLLALPAFLTNIFGVLFLFPPTRWAFSKFFKNMFQANANFRVFNFAPQNFSQFEGERDVTPQIIDVRPIQDPPKKD